MMEYVLLIRQKDRQVTAHLAEKLELDPESPTREQVRQFDGNDWHGWPIEQVVGVYAVALP
jgi:hypothetical protein